MPERLCIELFGALKVRCGEREITRFRTQKAAALLAYLALFQERTHSREQLAELF
jgi:DNA-binding SARP family transcriptional activator